MDAHQSAQEAAQVGLDERDGSDRNQCGHLLPGVEPGDEGGQLSEEVLEHEGPFGTRMGAGGNGVEPGARQDAGKGGRGRAVTCGSLSQPANPRGNRALEVANKAESRLYESQTVLQSR